MLITARMTRSVRSASPPSRVGQGPRHDLPGDAELVGEPAALDMLAALRKLLPQRVDFSLVVAIDHKRQRGRELVLRAAVQRQ